MNTKPLQVSTATQLQLTATQFGEVMLAKGAGEAAGQCKGINVFKGGVSMEDIKKFHLPLTRSLISIPQKKKAGIKKILPFLNPIARRYSEKTLEEGTQTPAAKTVAPTVIAAGTSGK